MLKQLGAGAQGCTYLVKRVDNNQLYAMKMIECLDESHANFAFKECIEVQDVGSHYLLCEIFEFFVHWDRQLSSMFFCIVTDYYPRGSLDSYLDVLHSRHQSVAESTVRIWLAEIIEALLFAFRKNVSHRALKPSNVYLQSNGSHVVVGDFCLPSVLSDLRTHNRPVIGSYHYAAPETAHSLTSGDQADVWSVGCIGLRMVLTGLRGVDNINCKLDDIKYTTSLLHQLTSLAEEFFSDHLLSLITRLLSVNVDNRPTLLDLANETFVINSMAEADDSRVSKQQLEYPYMQLPEGESLMHHVKYILENRSNELCVNDVFEKLLKVAQTSSEPIIYDSAKKKIIMKALKIHLAVEKVVVSGFKLIASLLNATYDEDDFVYSEEALDIIVEAMRRHVTEIDVQISAAFLCSGIAVSGKAAGILLHQLKVMPDLLLMLRQFCDDDVACTVCMNAMWSLTATGGNVRFLSEQKAAVDVVNIIKQHEENAAVLQAAYALILSLLLQDDTVKEISSLNCWELIFAGIRRHSSVPQLVANGCLALAAIVEADEESAYQMASEMTVDRRNAIQKIMDDIYIHNKENANIVSSICTLFIELSHYEDIASEMHHMNVGTKLFSQIQRNFIDNPEMLTKCKQIAANMTTVKPLLSE